MTLISGIAAKLAATILSCTSVAIPPNEDDLRNVQMWILKVFLSISLAGSLPGKVTGLVLSDTIYITIPGTNSTLFNKNKASHPKYYPCVTAGTTPWEYEKSENIWTSKLENQACIAGTKHGYQKFLPGAIDKTHYITPYGKNIL